MHHCYLELYIVAMDYMIFIANDLVCKDNTFSLTMNIEFEVLGQVVATCTCATYPLQTQPMVKWLPCVKTTTQPKVDQPLGQVVATCV